MTCGRPTMVANSAGSTEISWQKVLDLDAASTRTVVRMWEIGEIAKLTGTTPRTLRHYDELGLLSPSEVGANGYRRYDQVALVRLQRILLLRDMGLSLAEIGQLLAGTLTDREALQQHRERLINDRRRIEQQLASVERTLAALTEGKALMANEILDGFDHSQYREEVTQRWGAEAYEASDNWWRSMTNEERADFLSASKSLAQDWRAAAAAGVEPGSTHAQSLAVRHVAWLQQSWGGTEPSPEAIRGLADMYVADERFAANYGGVAGAKFVRDALASYLAED